MKSDTTVPLPRAIDATKLADTRIREILNVCDQIKSSDIEHYGLKGLPRSLRRRTRGHNSHKHGKRPNQAKLTRSKGVGKMETFMNRSMRRKEKFKAYTDPWNTQEESVCRLPTHVFHAKRLQMSKMDDSKFTVPLGAFGRGRGTRSFHHKLNSSCIVHDASYWCPIEIEGPSKNVSSLLLAISGGLLKESLLREGEYRITGYRVNRGSSKTKIGPIDLICTENDGISFILIWAHCIYSDILVRDLKDPLGEYAHLVKSVGRLGRIEIRGPASERVLIRQGQNCQSDHLPIEKKLSVQDIIWIHSSSVKSCDGMKSITGLRTETDNLGTNLASFLLNATNHAGNPLDLICIKKQNGYSIIVNRDIYAALFKAVSLSGAFIAGQMEWHWYHTIARKLFYPDDFTESPKFGRLVSTLTKNGHLPEIFMLDCGTADMIPAFVWATRNGTLQVGDILCYVESNKVSSSSRKITVDNCFTTGNNSNWRQNRNAISVGVVTSARPYALHSKYCSVAIIHSKLFTELAGNDKVKERLWAYGPHRRVLIPVTVKISDFSDL